MSENAKPSLFSNRWFTRAALVGGVGAAAAGLGLLNDLNSMFAPKPASVEDVQAIVEKALAQNGLGAGAEGLDAAAGQNLREAFATLIASGDARKKSAREAMASGDLDKARELMGGISEDYEAAANQANTEAAITWREYGALLYANQPSEAIKAYEAAALRDPTDASDYLQIGALNARLGNLDAAVLAYSQAIENGPDDNPVWTGSLALGIAAIDVVQGRPQQAEERYKIALELCPLGEGKHCEANALNGLGSLYGNIGRYDEAKQTLTRALEAYRAIDDRSGESAALINLGVLAADNHDYSAARTYYERSIALAEALGDSESIAVTTNNLGYIQRRMKQPRESRASFEKSLASFRQLQRRDAIALVLVNLASVDIDVGTPAAAGPRLKEAREIVEDMGFLHGLASVQREEGRMAAAMGDKARAVELLRDSLASFEAGGAIDTDDANLTRQAAAEFGLTL